jgi:hypothetical protein
MNVYVILQRSIIIISNDDYEKKKNKERLSDALPSPLLNPLEGPTM